MSEEEIGLHFENKWWFFNFNIEYYATHTSDWTQILGQCTTY